MRAHMHRLARKCQSGYATVCVETCIEQAHARNRTRDGTPGHVSDTTLHRMAHAFEPPPRTQIDELPQSSSATIARAQDTHAKSHTQTDSLPTALTSPTQAPIPAAITHMHNESSSSGTHLFERDAIFVQLESASPGELLKRLIVLANEPVAPTPTHLTPEQLAEEQEITRANAPHQIDLTLRRLISQHVAAVPKYAFICVLCECVWICLNVCV
eukprot:c9675_g1_i1.p1 GENE.c9675_g1_i1~~c9675_g1_i1.p1  ORF type:complete len:214 (+),score=44.87 c9675_g1_i1:482-1123(+)